MKNLIKNLFSIKNIKNCNNVNFKVITFLGIKIKFINLKEEYIKQNNIIKVQEKHIINLDKYIKINVLTNSKYFNAKWYIKKYDYNLGMYEALIHFINEGWKNLDSPSKYFNTSYYAKKYNIYNKNQLFHYLTEGRFYCYYPDNKNNYKSKLDNSVIEEYLNYKKIRKAKGVIYTCITNNYDDIEEIKTYKYLDKDWDYVCFTDNTDHIKKEQIGIWEIRPLQFSESDNTRNNRWHKLHPHLLFPDYELSIYIDANINILTPQLFSYIKTKKSNIILPKHFNNNCIYNELNWGINSDIDNINVVQEELDFIKNQGMPKNYGFTENNIIFRNHHDKEIINLMNEWWQMLTQYSKRDQFCFTYLLWKYKKEIDDITFENTRIDNDNFYVFDHKKGREEIK